MHHNVGLHCVRTMVVEWCGGFSIMKYNAKRVHTRAVLSAGECGFFSNFMLELAKNPDLKELVRMEEQQSDSQRGAAMEE
ncbi:hypothetical protein L484_010456 [Morus notabilis]|uniref:Uncharacterized protein n=1 Tax=Morus notabilis TaxID=981085 RepID=W9QCI5_9ROSA|nr:hypothetical protein L484_010456 [Morus notabilis]